MSLASSKLCNPMMRKSYKQPLPTCEDSARKGDKGNERIARHPVTTSQ